MGIKETITKEFGDNVIIGGNHLVEKKLTVIPVSPAVDMILGGGIPEGSFVTFTGQPKCGKSLANSATVYTPNGPKTMGKLKTGELVCTPDGQSAQIIGVYPQGKLDIYEVTFNDGSTTRCSLDHLWTVAKNNRRNNFVTIPLSEIVKQGIRYNDRNKWKIQLTQPVEFNETRSLEIDPYIFGCLLRDDGLSAKTPIMSTIDEDIRNKFKKFAHIHKLKITPKNQIDFGIVQQDRNVGNVLTKKLKKIGMMGKTSHTKYIPTHYKYSSVSHRFALIRGLMDTDGSNDNGLRAEYTTTSIVLARDVQEVLQSLGYTAKIVSRHTSYTGCSKKFLSYRIYVHGNDVNKLFSLKRKQFNHTRTKPDLFRTITSVQKVGTENATCIKIDTEEGLFLTNHFIVTHNTLTSLDFASNAQKKEYGSRPVYYLNIEGRLKRRDLLGIKGLDLENFNIIESTQGNILTGEKYLEIATQIISTVPNCVMIIDSYSAICTEAEMTSGMDKMQRADGAKLLSKFCRKAANIIPVNRNIVIGITHLMGNPTGYGAEFKEKSGQSIGYQCDVKLRAKTSKPWLLGTENIEIGKEVEWKAEWTAIAPPGGICTSYIRYGQGIDRYMEIIVLGCDLGLIDKAGAWYTLSYLGDEAKAKFQGTEKIRNFLLENEEAYNKLFNEIQKMMGFTK